MLSDDNNINDNIIKYFQLCIISLQLMNNELISIQTITK
jgi:hypothetical protein